MVNILQICFIINELIDKNSSLLLIFETKLLRALYEGIENWKKMKRLNENKKHKTYCYDAILVLPIPHME